METNEINCRTFFRFANSGRSMKQMINVANAVNDHQFSPFQMSL